MAKKIKRLFKKQIIKPTPSKDKTFAQRVAENHPHLEVKEDNGVVSISNKTMNELTALQKRGQEIYQRQIVLRKETLQLIAEAKQNRGKVQNILNQMTGIKGEWIL